MTKKDYEAFASAIRRRQRIYRWTKNEVMKAVELCKDVFMIDNCNFQPDKFERACYEGKHIRKAIAERF